MKNSKGKRMVQEDELQYLQELKENHSDPSASWGGSGSSYQAGNGITIADETISVDYGTGLTVDDETLVIDSSTVAMKSDLATVATTGDYDDLIDKPTIPDNITDNDVVLSHGGDTNKQIKITTMIGSTDGVQQTGIRVYGTSNNSSGTTLDTNLFEVRPSKATYRTPEVNFGTSTSTVEKVTFSSNCDIYVGSSDNKVLTTDNVGTYGVVPNPASTTGTLTGLTIGGTSYAIPSGGGSSYTFTNGLTESSGTVSWDLNDVIAKKVNNQSNNIVYIGNASSPDAGRILMSRASTTTALQDQVNGITGAGPFISVTTGTQSSNGNQWTGNGSGLSLGRQNTISTTSNSTCGIVVGMENNVQLNNDIVVGQGHGATSAPDNGIVLGKFSELLGADRNKYVFIIGNGTSTSARSNAMTISNDGIIVSKNLPAVDTTTDGTYVLKATVSSGVVTYAWVLEV